MEQRQAAVEAAQSAQKGLMGDLETLIMGADDTPLPELQRDMAARIQLEGVTPNRRNTRQLQGALNSLYGNSLYPLAAHTLRPDERQGIAIDVKNLRKRYGLPDVIEAVRDTWESEEENPPGSWDEKADELLSLITQIYNQRNAGPASWSPF